MENSTDVRWMTRGQNGLLDVLLAHKGPVLLSGYDSKLYKLLLNGSGCGFCKTCRDNPCGIKDGEKCTDNIANYIRECVVNEN